MRILHVESSAGQRSLQVRKDHRHGRPDGRGRPRVDHGTRATTGYGITTGQWLRTGEVGSVFTSLVSVLNIPGVAHVKTS